MTELTEYQSIAQNKIQDELCFVSFKNLEFCFLTKAFSTGKANQAYLISKLLIRFFIYQRDLAIYISLICNNSL